jgi:bifunctional DNA-binding transcriptional regulator/antitoxin component of YhaV-PrlF toxin-antitoxin module
LLAKLTAKNQITIPKEVLSKLPEAQYFDVDQKDGAIILKPVKILDTNLEKIREKIKKMGLSDGCVKEAVKWARSK